MPFSLTRAYIKILPPSAASGSVVQKMTGGDLIPFQYNPDSYKMSGSASFPSTPVPSARNAPPTQFRGTKAREISIEIFLDSEGLSIRDVEKDVKKLFACLTPHPSTRKGAPSPPIVMFGWGASPMPHFKAVLTSMSVTFNRFGVSGKASRATCAISAKEFLDPVQGSSLMQNPTSGAIDARSAHVMVDGESLPLIAFREYRNPNLWRAIAEINRIDDPMRLRSGTRLLIPSVEEAEIYA